MNGAESLDSHVDRWRSGSLFHKSWHLGNAYRRRAGSGNGNALCIGLFEGVVTGAADGYARMAGKPACTLLHLGPGLANGVANLHNASRAQVPIVNIVGQHANYHLQYDAPLTSDIEAIARPYSKWLRTSSATSAIGRDAAEAVVASRTAPGQIATLIVPADVAWSDGGVRRQHSCGATRQCLPLKSINHAASMLRSGSAHGTLAHRKCTIWRRARIGWPHRCCYRRETARALSGHARRRGAGALVQRIPYMPEQAVELLKNIRQLILVGAAAPVSYFAYPGKSSVLTPRNVKSIPGKPGEDYVGALDALMTALSLQNSKSMTGGESRAAAPAKRRNHFAWPCDCSWARCYLKTRSSLTKP